MQPKVSNLKQRIISNFKNENAPVKKAFSIYSNAALLASKVQDRSPKKSKPVLPEVSQIFNNVE